MLSGDGRPSPGRLAIIGPRTHLASKPDGRLARHGITRKTPMFRNLFLATALALRGHPHVIGGANLRIIGNGENFTVEVIGTPNTQGPAISRLVGQGENQAVEFLPRRG
jgi:hypothetical protein